jgi:hypothetical protein
MGGGGDHIEWPRCCRLDENGSGDAIGDMGGERSDAVADAKDGLARPAIREADDDAEDNEDEASLLPLLCALASPTLTTDTGSARRCAVGDGCGMSMAIARDGAIVAGVAAVVALESAAAGGLASPEARRLSGGGSAATGGELSASGDDDGDALTNAEEEVEPKADADAEAARVDGAKRKPAAGGVPSALSVACSGGDGCAEDGADESDAADAAGSLPERSAEAIEDRSKPCAFGRCVCGRASSVEANMAAEDEDEPGAVPASVPMPAPGPDSGSALPRASTAALALAFECAPLVSVDAKFCFCCWRPFTRRSTLLGTAGSASKSTQSSVRPAEAAAVASAAASAALEATLTEPAAEGENRVHEGEEGRGDDGERTDGGECGREGEYECE